MTRVGARAGSPGLRPLARLQSSALEKKSQGARSKSVSRGGDDPAMKAARLLESLFVRQFVQALGKDSREGSALFGKSVGRDIFQQMFKGAVADEIYGAGGLGLADQIVDQLRAGRGEKPVSVPRSLGDVPLAPATIATSSPLAVGARERASSVPTSTAKGGGESAEASARREVAVHDRAAGLRRMVQHRRARQVLGQHRRLGGIAFEAPARRGFVLPRDADGELHHPLGNASSARLSPEGSLSAPAGARVAAAASGQIVARTADSLVVAHGSGVRTTYRGLGEVSAQLGDLVLRDQEIGRVGPSGAILFSVERGQNKLKVSEINGEYFSRRSALKVSSH